MHFYFITLQSNTFLNYCLQCQLVYFLYHCCQRQLRIPVNHQEFCRSYSWIVFTYFLTCSSDTVVAHGDAKNIGCSGQGFPDWIIAARKLPHGLFNHRQHPARQINPPVASPSDSVRQTGSDVPSLPKELVADRWSCDTTVYSASCSNTGLSTLNH